MNNLERHALAKQQYEGKVFDTLYNGKFIIEKYVRSKEIHIRYLIVSIVKFFIQPITYSVTTFKTNHTTY